MKRVLVTGAGGQLGKSIQDVAAEFCEMSFHFLDRTGLDITRSDQVLMTFEKIKPDFCINCAAYTKVDLAEKQPGRAREVNVQGVENLVKACRQTGTTLIHISTDYVFDGTKKSGYLPGDTPNPINVYGKTKLEGEERIKSVLEKYFIVRTSWLYSTRYPPNFYLTILEKARTGESLSVTDSQRGCPTDAANLARYVLSLIEENRSDYGIKHFTDGEAMSWYEFALRIIEQHGLAGRVKLRKGDNYITFATRPENSVLR